jgi:hypothetical protein
MEITKNFIKSMIRDMLDKVYIPQPEPEVMYFYCRISPETTGLSMDIAIDDSGEYKINNHPLWVYVESPIEVSKKIYPRYYDSFYIPFTVEKIPKIVGDIMIVKELLSPKDIIDIKDFILANVKNLKDVATQKMSNFDFMGLSTPIEVIRGRYYPKPTFLNEMANILKRDSGLPVNIWVDNSGKDRLNKHSPDRIKFQNNKANKIQPDALIPISVHNNMVVFGNEHEIKISSYNLDLIRMFIEANIKLIYQLIYKEIKPEEFKKRVIKLDKKGNLIYPRSEVVSYVPKGKYVNGFRVVVSNNGLYNFIDVKGNLVSKDWFSTINNFIKQQDGRLAVSVKKDDTWYYLYPDGNLEKY